MDSPEVHEQESVQSSEVKDAAMVATHAPHAAVALQAGGGTCSDCARAAEANSDTAEASAANPEPTEPEYVFALGKVEPRFPSFAVEKEFMQATGHADTAGLTDRQAMHALLSERQNRYLVRQLCWVLTIEGLETYILGPRDPADLELLVEAARAAPTPMDVDVVVGMRGRIAPPEVCNGLMVPIVFFDQLYTFDRDSLIAAIPRPTDLPKKEEEQFSAAAAELFERITYIADNAGATDEHRALNYLTVRYPAIYERAAEAFRENSALTAVETRPSRLSGTRRIIDVIFSYTHRQTDVVDKYFVRVDVTEEWPFLITRLAPFYDR
jgi:hypothetical protein